MIRLWVQSLSVLTAACLVALGCGDDAVASGPVDGGAVLDAAADFDAGTYDPGIPGVCSERDCDPGQCDSLAGGCICQPGSYFDGLGCAPTRTCLADGSCQGECPIPAAPRLDVIAAAETLVFAGAAAASLQVGVSEDPGALVPDVWSDSDRVSLAPYEGSDLRVFARVKSDECEAAAIFSHVYRVRSGYPGSVTQPGHTAIARDDARIRGWASEVIDVRYGEAVDEEWRTPEQALGPAEGNALDVLVLGRGGSVTLGFEAPIADGEGPDFAVFENAHNHTFLELALVRVSSDGTNFAAFDTASLSDEPIAAYGALAPAGIHGFAGTYHKGFGSSFDLAQLRQHPMVVSGKLDLSAITQLRIDDVPGDGSVHDAFDRPVRDPYPATSSAGFDLDGVASF